METLDSAITIATPDDLVRIHSKVVEVVASLYDVPLAQLKRSLLGGLRSELAPFAEAMLKERNDREQALLMALAASASASKQGRPKPTDDSNSIELGLAFTVYSLRDDLHRDVTFGHYWRGESLEEIAESEHLRTLTIAQNHKRSLKELSEVIGEDVEPKLELWKAIPTDGPVADSPEALIKTITSKKDNPKLSGSGKAAIVNALLAVSRANVTSVGLQLGARSMRETHGRPQIALAERLGLYEKELVVAKEDREVYDRTRQYFISNPNEDWRVSLVHVFNKTGPQELNFALKTTESGVIVLSGSGRAIGMCTLEKPFFTFKTDSLPFEFTIRVAHKE